MEVVVVASRSEGIAVGGYPQGKFIKDRLVVKHLAQLPLHSLVEVYRCHWLLRIADVPHLDCQYVSRNYILSLPGKLSRRIAAKQVRQKIFLPSKLVFKSSCG